MSTNSGYLIKNKKGEKIFVFSKVQEPGCYPVHIGYNLTKNQVDDFQQTSPILTIGLEELDEKEQYLLGLLIYVRLALATGTVAITAKARSGKDYMANIIQQHFPKTSTIISLSKPIYEIDSIIRGEGRGKNRESLIMIGQSLREKDPNIWIKVWLRRCIDEYLRSSSKVIRFICPDLRQPNEYSFFKNLGAIIVSIQADGEKRLQKIKELDGEDQLNEKLLNDETEQMAGEYSSDWTIINNYDEKFKEDVEDFIQKVLIEQKGW